MPAACLRCNLNLLQIPPRQLSSQAQTRMFFRTFRSHQTSAGNFPKARRFRLSRLFEPRAAFSQFQRSCSIRTQRCDSHRKQHGKGVLRCLGGIPEGAGITSKSCHTAALFHGILSHRIKPVFLLDLAKSICSFLNRF